MNVRVHDRLGAWAEDKRPLVGIAGPIVAFAAEPVYRLMTTPAGIALQEQLARRDAEAWRRFYASPFDWLKELPLDQLPKASRCSGEDLDHWRQAYEKGPGKAADPATVQLSQEAQQKFNETLRQGQRDLFAVLADDDPVGVVDDSEIASWRTSAVAFLLRVAVPFAVRHRTSPQNAIRRATNIESPHWPSLDHLIDCDTELVRDECVAPVLFSPNRRETARRFRLGASSLASPAKPLTRNEVMAAAAGLVSCFGAMFDGDLTARQVRELFDLAEQARQNSERRCEPGLPKNNATLQKAIVRSRKKWQAWLDPDRNSAIVVRALCGKAA